jgi:hypothetical protein
MAEIKTKQNQASVEEFIESVKDEQKRKDCYTLLAMMEKVSGEKPKMWGSSLIGFGKATYKSPNTGREVDWFIIGFSPRKANLSLSFTLDINKYDSYLEKLGKHKTGVGCLYINKLSDVDLSVLQELIKMSIDKNWGLTAKK